MKTFKRKSVGQTDPFRIINPLHIYLEKNIDFTLAISCVKRERKMLRNGLCLFVCLFEALRPSEFFSHFGTASWVLPVLRNGDEMSCSRTQLRAPGEDRTCDLAIKTN